MMNSRLLSLLLLLLLVVLPISTATTIMMVDDSGNQSNESVAPKDKHTSDPRIYKDDGRIVFENFEGTVISSDIIREASLTLDACRTSYTSTHNGETGDMCPFTTGVTINGGTDITITNSDFTNIDGGFALEIINSIDITIANNVFENITSVGSDLNVIDISGSDNIWINNNDFYNSNASTSSEWVNVIRASNSQNLVIENNIIENNNILGLDNNLKITGINISGSVAAKNNVTITSNYMRNIQADTASFVSVQGSSGDPLEVVTYQSNFFYSNTFRQGSGFSFKYVDDIKSDGWSSTYSLTVKNESGFTAISYTNVNDVAQNFTYFASSNTETADLRGIKILNSNNITMRTVRVENIQTENSRIIGYDIESSTDVHIINGNVNSLTSTATGIDLDNSLSMYGAIVSDSTGVLIETTNFNNFVSNSQVFGLQAESSQLFTLSNSYDNNAGSVVHGLVLVDILAGSQFNSSSFTTWDAPQIYGAEVINTTASVLFYDLFFSKLTYSTFGNAITVDNSADLVFLDNKFQSIDSNAPFFATSVFLVSDANNITLRGNVFFEIDSFFSLMSSFEATNMSDSLLTDNSFVKNFGYETAYVGVYFKKSTNLNISFNEFQQIEYDPQSTSLQLNEVTDKVGYGIVLEATTNSDILNNTILNVDQWYESDADSVGITLFGNTIDDVTDFITTFTKPADLVYDADEDAGAILSWTATTSEPSAASNYTINIDGDVVASGDWTSGEPINYTISGIEFGTYTLTIELVQSHGFVSTDVVIITATELTPPNILTPLGTVNTVENSNAKLTWDVFEANPASYSIFQGDIEIGFGSYKANDTIVFELKDITVGTYNYTLTVRDQSGNEASDTVQVSVVKASPITIDLPVDEISVEANSSATIDFTASGTIGGNFIVSINDFQSDSGTWTSGEEVNYNISGLEVGQYFFNFFIIDEVGNTNEFDVTVNVVAIELAEEEDGFVNRVDQGARDLVENVQSAEIDEAELIPLAAATFAGGAIFFPGMKLIRSRLSKS